MGRHLTNPVKKLFLTYNIDKNESVCKIQGVVDLYLRTVLVIIWKRTYEQLIPMKLSCWIKLRQI